MRYLPLLALFLSASIPVMSAQATILTTSSPDVEKGRATLRYGAGFEDRDSTGDFWTQEVEAEYSPTDNWKTGFKFLENQKNGDWYYAATGWKNTLQFMKQKNGLPFSAAVRIEYEKAGQDEDADDVKLRLLTGRKDGAWTALVNAGISREVGANREQGISADVRGSVRYAVNSYLAPSLDYLGNIGQTNNFEGFDRQDHRLGAGLQGDFSSAIGYQIGYLAGISDSAPDSSFMMNLSYDF